MKDVSGVQMILHSKAVFLLPIQVQEPFQKYDQISMLVQQINSQKVCLFWFFRASLVSISPLGDIQKCVTNEIDIQRSSLNTSLIKASQDRQI